MSARRSLCACAPTSLAPHFVTRQREGYVAVETLDGTEISVHSTTAQAEVWIRHLERKRDE